MERRVGWVSVLATGLLSGVCEVHAEPITHPEVEPCAVEIVSAPAEVAAEIEAWVRAEPRCVQHLSVRVRETDDGLVLSAIDGDGHLRERIVPDAESAAVLVVSWMADDSIAPRPAPAPSPPAASASAAGGVVAPHRSLVLDSALGLERTSESSGVVRARAVMLGVESAASDDADNVGARAQVDLFGWRRFRFGVAGVVAGDHAGGRVIASTTWTRGRFGVRAQLGIGANVTVDHHEHSMFERGPMDESSDGIVAELGLLGSVRVRDRWSLLGGPIVSATPGDQVVQGQLFLGVQRGL